MSEVSQGPGWWLATNGRWYPPEMHPQYRSPADGSAIVLTASGLAQRESWRTHPPKPLTRPERHIPARRRGLVAETKVAFVVVATVVVLFVALMVSVGVAAQHKNESGQIVGPASTAVTVCLAALIATVVLGLLIYLLLRWRRRSTLTRSELTTENTQLAAKRKAQRQARKDANALARKRWANAPDAVEPCSPRPGRRAVS